MHYIVYAYHVIFLLEEISYAFKSEESIEIQIYNWYCMQTILNKTIEPVWLKFNYFGLPYPIDMILSLSLYLIAYVIAYLPMQAVLDIRKAFLSTPYVACL